METLLFKAGDVFDSFDAFKAKLETFQTENNVTFVTEYSNKLKDGSDGKRIKYNYVKFACKQGTQRKSESKGLRPNQRTVKQNCGAYIRLVRDDKKDGHPVLKIKSLELNHKNHPTDNRAKILKAPVKSIIPTKRQMRQHLLESQQGPETFPSDVHTYFKRFKVDEIQAISSVEELLMKIRSEDGHIMIGVNEHDDFEFVFYSTAYMGQNLEKFCDVVVLDIGHEVSCQSYYLINVLCVDAEGNGHPVLHGFVQNERQECMVSCLNFLKSLISPSKDGPSLIFVDKDFSQVSAVQETFPYSLVKFCSFHALDAVCKALEHQGLSSQQVEMYVSYFKKQRDTRSLERFQEITNIIRHDAPSNTVLYFQTNWWDFADMWATHTELNVTTLQLTVTNHMETYHHKIKQKIHSQMCLADSIKILLQCDTHLVQKVDMNSYLNSTVHHFNTKHPDTVMETLLNDLTAFAGKLVIEQYILSKKIAYTHTQNLCTSTCSDSFQVCGEIRQQHPYTTSAVACNCNFICKFHLPCRHVFSLRHFLGQPLYISEMTKDSRFLKSRHKTEKQNDENGSSTTLQETDAMRVEILAKSQEGRCALISQLTSRINSVYETMDDGLFVKRLKQLEQIFQFIYDDKNFSIADLSVKSGTENPADLTPDKPFNRTITNVNNNHLVNNSNAISHAIKS